MKKDNWYRLVNTAFKYQYTVLCYFELQYNWVAVGKVLFLMNKNTMSQIKQKI